MSYDEYLTARLAVLARYAGAGAGHLSGAPGERRPLFAGIDQANGASALRVELPGPKAGKLGQAHRIGGGELVTKLTEKLTGVSFDATVTMNLASVPAVVDALGPLRVCLPVGVRSWHRNGVTYPQGCREYGGAEIFDLLRQRYAPRNGEWDRDESIHRVAVALWEKASRTGVPARGGQDP